MVRFNAQIRTHIEADSAEEARRIALSFGDDVEIQKLTMPEGTMISRTSEYEPICVKAKRYFEDG